MNEAVAREPETYTHWIGGAAQSASSGKTFDTYNPTSGDVWGHFALGNADDVSDAVQAARDAFVKWREISPTRRGRLMMRWADAINENAEKIGRIETAQNGKLLNEMILQARIVPDWLYYYGGLADKIEGRVIPIDRTSVLNYTLREPLGVVGVIMPWNSPLFLTVMAVAPALAAGNTVVIKPSEVTPASMIEAVRIAEEIGIPKGVLNV
ncbi:MAG: aldehyde dehydrogenase family protein, partial [Bauldia litoralis]